MCNFLVQFLILDLILLVTLYFILMRQADKFFEMYDNFFDVYKKDINKEGDNNG